MKKRQPTYSKQDILEESNISVKQLRTWMEEGLLVLELGSRGGRETRFTEIDLQRVFVIRKLVVDEKYKIATVKRMLDSRPGWNIDFRNHFWDYAQGRWLTADQIAARSFSMPRNKPPDSLLLLAWTAWLMQTQEQHPDVFQTKVANMQRYMKDRSAEVLGYSGRAREFMRQVWDIRSDLHLAEREDADDYRRKLQNQKKKFPEAMWALRDCAQCLGERLAVLLVDYSDVTEWSPLCDRCQDEQQETDKAYEEWKAEEGGTAAMPIEKED